MLDFEWNKRKHRADLRGLDASASAFMQPLANHDCPRLETMTAVLLARAELVTIKRSWTDRSACEAGDSEAVALALRLIRDDCSLDLVPTFLDHAGR